MLVNESVSRSGLLIEMPRISKNIIGILVPDRVRVSWGRVENFKCVDYFQIEYYQTQDRQVWNPQGRQYSRFLLIWFGC